MEPPGEKQPEPRRLPVKAVEIRAQQRGDPQHLRDDLELLLLAGALEQVLGGKVRREEDDVHQGEEDPLKSRVDVSFAKIDAAYVFPASTQIGWGICGSFSARFQQPSVFP